MPIYEYECNACGTRHEFIQKFSEGAKRKCPECGANRLRKLVSAAAFHLKGDGWYVTDFRDKEKKKKDGESTSDTGSDTKSDAKSEKKETKKKDSKKDSASSGGGKAAAE